MTRRDASCILARMRNADRLSVPLAPEERQALDALALAEERTLAQVARMLIVAGLEQVRRTGSLPRRAPESKRPRA